MNTSGRKRGPSRRDVAARLWEKSIPEPTSGCLLWTAAVNANGYGVINVDGSARLAHRVALQCAGVEVPEDALVLHHCDVPCCINPRHLRVGTHADNAQDMVVRHRNMHAKRRAACNVGFLSHRFGKRKTHCVSGHEYTFANTRIDKRGRQTCRACQCNHQKKYRQQRKAS